ncbi:MAG: hypothetical protein HFI30_05340 [Lachnospiraceae bacterium]|jgi:hypothetical protein|nr:hypothetical protein [Lachnospiraceae bacterium]
MRRYHDFKNDIWDDFNRETRDKKIWIWGGSTAKYIVSDLRKFDSLWSVEGIVDNDENKWGRNYITGW